MKLYEIDAMLRGALETAYTQAQENEGEIDELTAYYIDNWEAERDVKISNICKMIKNFNSESDAVAEEAKKLTERARVLKNKAESSKKFLSEFMRGDLWRDENSVISYRKSTSVNVTNEEMIPACFIEMIPRIKKADIKEQLKTGVKIDGAVLVKKQNIQIK